MNHDSFPNNNKNEPCGTEWISIYIYINTHTDSLTSATLSVVCQVSNESCFYTPNNIYFIKRAVVKSCSNPAAVCFRMRRSMRRLRRMIAKVAPCRHIYIYIAHPPRYTAMKRINHRMATAIAIDRTN